jgi:hypothetical protein
MKKVRTIILAGHAALMRRKEKYVGNPEGKNHMEDIGVYRRVVLKLILKG